MSNQIGQEKSALEGLKVLDFTWVVAGPFLTTVLGDHGATVVKLESNLRFDYARAIAPFKDGKPDLDGSGYFSHQNTSKLGLSVNLTVPKGMEIISKLIKWADILIENMSPEKMDKLGLGYDDAKKLNPGIIYMSISLQGREGPYAHFAGLGQMANAAAGFWELCGWPDRGPSPPHGPYSDYVSPCFGLAAVLAAVDYKRRTGIGQYLDTSMLETTLQLFEVPVIDYVVNGRIWGRAGNRSPQAVPHGVFRCKGDDRWCAVTVQTEAQWRAFCEVLDDQALAEDQRFATFIGRKRYEDELEDTINQHTIMFSAEELAGKLQEKGIPSQSVQKTSDLFEDQQLVSRGFLNHLNHRVIGSIVHCMPPFRLPETPARQFPFPCLGEHSQQILRDFLGYGEDEINELIVSEVIACGQ